ncbi:HD phosphohydrolase domain-containing protein [Basidiobolus meristosporus CBS 931.73]|uniref:HD phosphohydrolase domain-containing protein n=1 Tax=Basidiobolus meristosporus CBS 931.73 TaxID=1314790 RepID=A0A1Y1XU23_9FUNG|nr:HD phosphohydrolase domain-containing protein [Basidiobolus meristosporus CBS 931.73]|eukprot:ORX88996.1 HD phosphohydrolase domain-containing protein [Basidiobolus meristosporus CBS 931.73]
MDTRLTKYINDPIHGYINIDEHCLDIIDTEQFQRLRDLKQLGPAYFVFPGASHNRFEHSIGVSHLAGTLIERLKASQPELEIDEQDIKCVKLAGLCHDLGHGPFSHIFDNEFIPRSRPDIVWSHEQASEMMLENLIEENYIDIDKQEIDFIKDLIIGESRSTSQQHEKRFLFDIVANKRNSVDVDKFDYIERDCYNLGIKSSYDSSRLMTFSRVIDNQICFHHKEVYNMYEMFHTRYSLFKRIYTHRVGKSIEYMIIDAMLAADPYLNISKAIESPQDYLHLTDDILKQIERSKSEELLPARQIIKRIRQRQLYKFVDEFIIPSELKQYLTKSMVNEEQIVAQQKTGDNIKLEDVIVEWLSINYGKRSQNPVDSIKFFSRFNGDEAFSVPKTKVSYLVPEHFEEIVIRVFARDVTKIQQIQLAFRRLLKQFKGRIPESPDINLEPNYAHTYPNNFKSPSKRRYEQPDSLNSSPTRVFSNPETPCKNGKIRLEFSSI